MTEGDRDRNIDPEGWREKIDKNEVGENESTKDEPPPQPTDDDD